MINPNQPFGQTPHTLGPSITPLDWATNQALPADIGGGYYRNNQTNNSWLVVGGELSFVDATYLSFFNSPLNGVIVYASYIFAQPISCNYALMRFYVDEFGYNGGSPNSFDSSSVIIKSINEVRITGNGWYSIPIVVNPLVSTSDPINLTTRGTNFYIEIYGASQYDAPLFKITNLTIQCVFDDDSACLNCKTGEYAMPITYEDDGEGGFQTEQISMQSTEPYCGEALYNNDFSLKTNGNNYQMRENNGVLTTRRYANGFQPANANVPTFASFGSNGDVYFSTNTALISLINTNGGPFPNTVQVLQYINNPPTANQDKRPSLITATQPFDTPYSYYKVRFYLDSLTPTSEIGFVNKIIVSVIQLGGNEYSIGEIPFTGLGNVRKGYYEFYYYTLGPSTQAKLAICSGTPLGNLFFYKISDLTVEKIATYDATLIPSFRINLFKQLIQTSREERLFSSDYTATAPNYPMVAQNSYYYYRFELGEAFSLLEENPCFRVWFTKESCNDKNKSAQEYAQDLDVFVSADYKLISNDCGTLRIKAGQDALMDREVCAFGFTYPTFSTELNVQRWYHLTRIYGELRNPQYDGETITYQDSHGKKRIVYAESREFLEMVVNLSPKHVHNFLRLACRHDRFSVDDGNDVYFYFTRTETYSPTWIRTRLVAPAFLEIEVREQDLKKELCCAGILGEYEETPDDQRVGPYLYSGVEPTPDANDTIFDLTFDLTFE